MKSLLRFASLLLLGFMVTACSPGNNASNSTSSASVTGVTPPAGQSSVKDAESEKNILNIAAGSKDHTTLAAAVGAAGLQDVLTNAGPITVFAPNNAAFEKLPAGTVDELLKPENKAKLKKIITFHAAPGNYGPNNIRGVMGIGQATGDKVKVEVKDGTTLVNGAKVLGSVKASNGWVHVIDGVLLPPEK